MTTEPAELAARIRGYAEQLAGEQVTGGRAEDGVTVLLGLDGVLVDVRIAPWVRQRYAPDHVAQLVLAAIAAAERTAAERRAQLLPTGLTSG